MKTKARTIDKTSTKKRDRLATESALIDAAMKLFATQGYEKTRTLEIARRAKVNEALIARYFGGKEGLLVAVLQDTRSSRKQMKKPVAPFPSETWVPNLMESKNIKDALELFFKSGQVHFKEKEAFIRIALSQSLVDPRMGDLLRERTMGQSFLVLQNELQQMIGKKIKGEKVESMVMLLMACNFAFNFMGRVVHRIDEKRLESAKLFLIEALSTHLS